MIDSEYSAKLEKLKLLEERKKIEEGLPHLYGYPWYDWAWEFFQSTSKTNLLVAANQISKSSTQIRKAIHWATEPSLWPHLWKHRPRQFWYMYPSAKQTRIEFETKWIQFLPTGEYKKHPQYGWKPEWQNRELVAIKFNTGLTIYFKSYTQDPTVLQSATVDALFLDEELPENLYPELVMRLNASDGYYHNVFTATLGQDLWRRAMEPEEHEDEFLPEASKWVVSMYDCQKYMDGSPGPWTDEKIQIVKNRCSSHEEILKRVFGRFILPRSGKKYHAFDMKRHIRPVTHIPESWSIYEGVDVGSGSTKDRKEGHPSAITFIAINPARTQGRVILGWRGDGEKTTAGDVFLKHLELKKQLPRAPILQCYDPAAADFKTISDERGEPFVAANKSHELGEQIINVLFKNNMMTIDDEPELRKLAHELSALKKDTPKNKAKDDFADSFRYALTRAPWDFSLITGEKPAGLDAPVSPTLTAQQLEIAERRAQFDDGKNLGWGIEEEIREYNDLYGD